MRQRELQPRISRFSACVHTHSLVLMTCSRANVATRELRALQARLESESGDYAAKLVFLERQMSVQVCGLGWWEVHAACLLTSIVSYHNVDVNPLSHTHNLLPSG